MTRRQSNIPQMEKSRLTYPEKGRPLKSKVKSTTAWICAKTSIRTLATKKLTVVSRQRPISYFLLHKESFYHEQHDYRPPSTLLAWLGPLRHFPVFLIEDTAILTQLRWSRQNRRRCWTHRTRLPDTSKKLAEALGQMYTRWLLRRWWWLVGPKLVLDHTAASVPEVMDRRGIHVDFMSKIFP
jgi:hypothetical protein